MLYIYAYMFYIFSYNFRYVCRMCSVRSHFGTRGSSRLTRHALKHNRITISLSLSLYIYIYRIGVF